MTIPLASSSAIVGAVFMALQALIIYRVQAGLGNPVLALSVALGTTLIGAGLGALILRSKKRIAAWGPSGFTAFVGCLCLGLFGEIVVNFALSLEIIPATMLMAGFVFLCCLPLGLPFLAVMDSGSQEHNNIEGLVIACDGIGGVVGAALASVVVMTVGFNALAALAAILLLIFSTLGSHRLQQ